MLKQYPIELATLVGDRIHNHDAVIDLVIALVITTYRRSLLERCFLKLMLQHRHVVYQTWYRCKR